MSDATLFSSVRSPHCFKVAIVLEEKRVGFDRVEIDLPARQQKRPPYLAINPRGQVPAYLDDAGAHLDSLDVMLHLEARHPEPRMLPADAASRDAALAWIERSSGPMREVSHELYWQLLEPPAGGPDEAAVRDLLVQGEAQLAAIDAALRKHGRRWLVPADGGQDRSWPTPSLADVAVYAWVSGYARFGLPRNATSLPTFRSWLARMDARPSVVASRGVRGRPFEEWLRERASAASSGSGSGPG